MPSDIHRLLQARAVVGPLLGLIVAGCASPGTQSADPATVSPSRSAAAATERPTATPRPSAASPPQSTDPAAEGPVVVTFLVAGEEEYRVRLTDPDDIAIAQRLLAGEEAPRIPNGLVLSGDGGVNAPWSWHIDPDDFEFADVTIEVCDGRPSDVERGQISGERFCPWSAEVVEIEP